MGIGSSGTITLIYYYVDIELLPYVLDRKDSFLVFLSPLSGFAVAKLVSEVISFMFDSII
jgi:hypothetical protein